MPHRRQWYERYAAAMTELLKYAYFHRDSQFPEDPKILEILEKSGLSKAGIELVESLNPGMLYFKRIHGVSPRLTANLARIFSEEGLRRGDHNRHY